MEDTEVTGGRIVVDVLASLGVRHVFGVPGGQTLAITDALRDRTDMSFVTTHHEGGAAVMADAYGRLTGWPGVCLATTGPGATNLLTGVGGALRDSSPVLVITCNNKAGDLAKDDAQNASHVDVFRSLTKWARLVTRGEGIQQAIEEAFVVAMSGTKGPVLLDFARDAIEDVVQRRAEIPTPHPLCRWVSQRPTADAETLREAASIVLNAKRPVLWLGNGAADPRCSDAALKFAEALQVPIITTFAGIGAVPTRHPMVFGVLSRMGTSLSSRILAESDLVIAVGNSLNAISTARWTTQMPRVVHIDVEPSVIGRYYADRTFGVVGDGAKALTGLRDTIIRSDEAGPVISDRRDWIRRFQEMSEEWWNAAESHGHQMAAASPAVASPAALVTHLRAIAPSNTLLIPDAGNPGVWSYLWDVREVGCYIKPVGFGNMGFAVPAAVAAATQDPDRPILVLVGDGSLGMTLAELETVARVGGRIAIVVLNDAGYGNIRQEQIVKYGQRTIGVDFGPVRYAKAASALGIMGETTADLSTIGELVSSALAKGPPCLLDVAIDRTVDAWTFPAFQRYVAQ